MAIQAKSAFGSAVILFLAAALLPACGGGGGGGTSGGTATGVAGVYQVNATINDTDCGGRTRVEQWRLEVVQTGSAATVKIEERGDFAGTVLSNKVTASGTFADSGGYTTYTSIVFTVVGDDLTGSILWTFSKDASGSPVECQGSIALRGSRGTPSNLTGTYFLTAEIDATDCGEGIREEDWTVTVDQSGSEVALRLPMGDLFGLVVGAQATVSGIYAEGNAYVTVESLAFTVADGVFTGTGTWTRSPNASGAPVECQGSVALYGFRR